MIETDRLLLRRWRDDDLPALTAMNADPEVMRYVGDGLPRTPEQSAAALVEYERAWQARGFGLFAIELRTAEPGPVGALAGWAGLAVPEFLPEVMPAVEIGWRLARPYWGHGIATEAAVEVLRFAFEYARVPRLISICHVDNTASAKVMAKLGMTEERRTTVPAHGKKPVLVTELARGRYLRTRT
ncbi:GNAT family N-acetyltransferase [Embleya sp. NBC_00888]|uniref:GNAT family N-acetyltransferase n=1 Tax=Embleya sp. NBC_00888 TaxID=2975960 RepID=UPI003863AB9C|nr:GNAT family N-acetyltransferase [Embleya sp. NBC_00888]